TAQTGTGFAASSATGTHAGTAPPSSRAGLLAIVALFVVVLVGGGVVAFLKLGKGSSTASASSLVVSATAASASSQHAEPEADGPRTVHVTIEPKDAQVKVDGNAAIASDGTLEFKGALGTVHAITVSQGGRETTVPVVIASGGAVPDRVTLGAAPAASVSVA